MLIDPVLQRALDSGDLEYLPMHKSDPKNRTMFLGREIQDLLDGPFIDVEHETRIGMLRADLETWVKGEEILVCLTPFKHKTAYLGRLDPPGDATWDIRSRAPSPSLRVFGCFLDCDVFVALAWWPRRKQVSWSTKAPLGDDPLEWRIAIHDVQTKWHSILPGLVPVAGDKVTKYVSAKFRVAGA